MHSAEFSQPGAHSRVPSAASQRIMHLCLSLNMGGAEMLAVQMINDQALRFAHSPLLVALAQCNNPILPSRVTPPVSSTVLDMREGLSRVVLLSLRNLIKSARTEVIHAHNPSPLLAATIACAGLPVQIIYTHHGSGIPAVFSKYLPLRAWLLRKTSAFVGVSAQATEKMQEAFGGMIPPSRLHTIINGVAPNENTAAPFQTKALPQLWSERADFTIGYVGRLAPEKRVDLLIEALGRLRANGVNCRLVLVGDGELRPEHEAQVAQMGLTAHVLFMGVQSNIGALHSEFDVFVNSSRTEGVSLSILEAMSAGLPIVATAVGGTPLLIEDSVSGRLVEPESPEALAAGIQSLLIDAKLRQLCGNNAKCRASEQFSFRAMMNKYEALYASSCANSGRTGKGGQADLPCKLDNRKRQRQRSPRLL